MSSPEQEAKEKAKILAQECYSLSENGTMWLIIAIKVCDEAIKILKGRDYDSCVFRGIPFWENVKYELQNIL